MPAIKLALLYFNFNKVYHLKQEEKEITKSEFKSIYFQHASPNSGWTVEYWNTFYEKGIDQQYFIYPSENYDATQMFIRKDGNKHCIFFLSEESTESFFDFPGKD